MCANPYRPAWAVVSSRWAVELTTANEVVAAHAELVLKCAGCGRVSGEVAQDFAIETSWVDAPGWAGLCPECITVIARAIRSRDPAQLEAAANRLTSVLLEVGP